MKSTADKFKSRSGVAARVLVGQEQAIEDVAFWRRFLCPMLENCKNCSAVMPRRSAMFAVGWPAAGRVPIPAAASVQVFLPHLGDRLRRMGYIALHNESARTWRGGESALNWMDGNPLPR
ncbi:hypothetical protein EJ066_10005 [Mesorhizobium sp. M9A.F.Ca.ET.002.03.1.2]|nr:hypothetical protein EJ066_10005 [Mesorhizobium sp. M9A.F.Ca.ET.002.03.1.2]